jgi:hypothetical protein
MQSNKKRMIHASYFIRYHIVVSLILLLLIDKQNFTYQADDVGHVDR